MGRYIFVLVLLGSLAIWTSTSTARPAASQTATPVVTATALPGWPGPSSHYLGRYRLTASNNKRKAHKGQLTVFMRTFRAGVPPTMSGILALYGHHDSNVFYLTQFVHTGTRLKATVTLGSYAGPVIGGFVVTSFKGKTMKSVGKVRGMRKLILTFFRFSTNPSP